MPSLPFCILILIIILLMGTTTTRAEYCESGSTPCKGEDIRPYITFPFQLREFGNESDRCGYPGFELFCNKYRNQTLINLPNAGDFVVTGIDPSDQTVDVKDPDDCLPKRLLQPGSIDFTNSPFEWSISLFYDLVNLTFLNCSSKDGKKSVPHPGQIVPCLSTPNYSVVYIQSSLLPIPAVHNSCRVIFPALVPRKDVKLASIVGPSNLFPYMKFPWKFPDCKHCYHCGFSRDSGDEVTCIDGKENGDGDWMKTKLIGITLTVGVSGLIILVAYMLSGNRSEATGTEHSGSRTNSVPEVSGVALRGLHSSSIENYPTTEVGENGELPNPNDSICSICLSEYQPKETLRTLPDCNHYFHAGCIHGWLKINLTCPLCRN